MAASQDFQQAMRIGNIGEAIKTALSEAIELEITTWVVSAEDGSVEQSDPQNALPGYRMTTRINIVDGDIENEIGSQFIGQGPYRELREFHLNQVKQGQEIIRRNLEAIKELFSFLLDARSPETTKPIGEGSGRSLPASVHPEVVEPLPTSDYAALPPTEVETVPPPVEKEIAAPAGRLWGDATEEPMPPSFDGELDMGEGLEDMTDSSLSGSLDDSSLDASLSFLEEPAFEEPAVEPPMEPAMASEVDLSLEAFEPSGSVATVETTEQPLIEKEIPCTVENLWGDRDLNVVAEGVTPTNADQLPDGLVSAEMPTTPIEIGAFPVESVAFGAGDEDISASTGRLWGDEMATEISPDASIADMPVSDRLEPPASSPAMPDLSMFDETASVIPDLTEAIGAAVPDLPDLTGMGDLDAALSAIPDVSAVAPSPTEAEVIDFPADLFDETVEPEWEVFPPDAAIAESPAPSETAAVDLAMFDNVASPELSELSEPQFSEPTGSEPELPGLDAFQDLLSPETTGLAANLSEEFPAPATPAAGITSDSLSALFGSDPPVGEADRAATMPDLDWAESAIPTETAAMESSTSIPKEFLDGDFLSQAESDQSADMVDFPSEFSTGLSAEAEQALDNLFAPNEDLAEELTDELSSAIGDDFGDVLSGNVLGEAPDAEADDLNWDAIVSDPMPTGLSSEATSPADTPDVVLASDASLDLDADSLAALFAEPPAEGNVDSNPFDQADVGDLSFELEESGESGADPLDALFGEPGGDESSPSELDLLMDLDGSPEGDADAADADPFANFPVNLPTSGRGFGGSRQTPSNNPKKKADPNASEG